MDKLSSRDIRNLENLITILKDMVYDMRFFNRNLIDDTLIQDLIPYRIGELTEVICEIESESLKFDLFDGMFTLAYGLNQIDGDNIHQFYYEPLLNYQKSLITDLKWYTESPGSYLTLTKKSRNSKK